MDQTQVLQLCIIFSEKIKINIHNIEHIIAHLNKFTDLISMTLYDLFIHHIV